MLESCTEVHSPSKNHVCDSIDLVFSASNTTPSIARSCPLEELCRLHGNSRKSNLFQKGVFAERLNKHFGEHLKFVRWWLFSLANVKFLLKLRTLIHLATEIFSSFLNESKELKELYRRCSTEGAMNGFTAIKSSEWEWSKNSSLQITG